MPKITNDYARDVWRHISSFGEVKATAVPPLDAVCDVCGEAATVRYFYAYRNDVLLCSKCDRKYKEMYAKK